MAFGSGLDGSYPLGIRMGIIARFTADNFSVISASDSGDWPTHKD